MPQTDPWTRSIQRIVKLGPPCAYITAREIERCLLVSAGQTISRAKRGGNETDMGAGEHGLEAKTQYEAALCFP